ncbi:MAG: hypothetical protein DRI92_05430 [Aquificota bacterium]|nr:MAG: hypothetical protein DRI92_05430 [Aquificota bacterium]
MEMETTLTVRHVLEDKASELYTCCMGIYRPVTQGKIVLSKIRKDRYRIDVRKVLEIDLKMKIQILDILSDVVTENRDISELPQLMDELDKAISKLEKMKDTFRKIDNLFKRLNESEREKIFKTAIFVTRRNVESLRDFLGWMLWEGELDDVRDFLVVDQVLVTVRDILSHTLLKDVRSWEKRALMLAVALWLLLRLWAYKRRKISPDDLERDLSALSLLPDESLLKREEYRTVMSVMGR